MRSVWAVPSDEVITKFRKFIETFYYNNLLNTVKKNTGALVVEFNDIAKFDLELADQLINNFDDIAKDAEEAIKQFDIPEAQYPIKFRMINLPKSAFLPIRNIRAKNLGKLIETEGLIRQASDVRPKVTVTEYECPNCGAVLRVDQVGSKLREPTRCACGRKGKFKLSSQRLVDVQRLVVEEPPEALVGGEQAKRMQVFVESDLLDPALEKRRYPGNKINVVG